MKKTWSKVLATVLVLAMVLCMPGFAASVDTVDYDADHAASADELTDADLPELLSSDGNHYPIVMVHGLFGWGGTEVLGLNYWGGFSSLRDILNNAGYEVYTPSIGPVASNWDRACELYDYLANGNIKNSVNFPDAPLERMGVSRVCILHQTVPPMLNQILELACSTGLNVENMINKAYGAYAYAMMDLNGCLDDDQIARIDRIPEVIRVRVV